MPAELEAIQVALTVAAVASFLLGTFTKERQTRKYYEAAALLLLGLAIAGPLLLW